VSFWQQASSGQRARWWEEGEDPDYRFSLANERTFLAWIRTALALLAGAVALKQLVPPFSIPGLRTGLSVMLAALGLAIAITAYRQWAGNEVAMRHGRTLPRSLMLPWLSGLLALAGIVVVIDVLTGSL